MHSVHERCEGSAKRKRYRVMPVGSEHSSGWSRKKKKKRIDDAARIFLQLENSLHAKGLKTQVGPPWAGARWRKWRKDGMSWLDWRARSWERGFFLWWFLGVGDLSATPGEEEGGGGGIGVCGTMAAALGRWLRGSFAGPNKRIASQDEDLPI